MAETTQLWGAGVQISPPRLYRVDFHWEGRRKLERSKATTDFHLGVHRLGEFKLGVEFGSSVADVPGLTASAVYRMECSLIEGSPERDNAELAFRSIASRLAPTVIYPYVRETLTSLAAKARLSNFVLPIVNFGTVFDPAEIEIPKWEADDPDSDEDE